MPELPEVETVKEKLKERLLGRIIKKVDLYWHKIIAYPSVDKFINDIKDQTIINITRRGKWLVLELDKDYLLIHLRMEGKFFFKKDDEDIIKHEHVIFYLDNNVQLRYHDTRKFGKMYLIEKDKLYTSKPLSELGLEPFDIDLTVNYLQNKMSRKRLPIKTVLLDQSIIVGIGNIYADEILFKSGINPYLSANKLNKKQLQSIINNSRNILNEAIQAGGTTIRSYVSLDNKKGAFQTKLYVHSRAKQPCLICGHLIIKTAIGGRGTYFCPRCQKVRLKGGKQIK